MSKSISLYECTHIVQDIDFNLVPFPALTPEWPDTPGPTPPPAAPPLPVLSRADVVAPVFSIQYGEQTAAELLDSLIPWFRERLTGHYYETYIPDVEVDWNIPGRYVYRAVGLKCSGRTFATGIDLRRHIEGKEHAKQNLAAKNRKRGGLDKWFRRTEQPDCDESGCNAEQDIDKLDSFEFLPPKTPVSSKRKRQGDEELGHSECGTLPLTGGHHTKRSRDAEIPDSDASDSDIYDLPPICGPHSKRSRDAIIPDSDDVRYGDNWDDADSLPPLLSETF